jgi:hypothetical protein
LVDRVHTESPPQRQHVIKVHNALHSHALAGA